VKPGTLVVTRNVGVQVQRCALRPSVSAVRPPARTSPSLTGATPHLISRGQRAMCSRQRQPADLARLRFGSRSARTAHVISAA